MDFPSEDEERREFPRYVFDVLSLVYVGETPEKIVGRTRNISAKGAFLKTEERLEEKTPVRVEIFLMNEEEKKEPSRQIQVIQASGEVVRIEPEGIAISFNKDFDTRLSSIEEITGSAL